MRKKSKVGALISGGGTNLQAIIDACENGSIDAEMVFVGTDNPEAKGLDRAKKHNIPTFVVDYKEIIRGCKGRPESIVLPDDFSLDDMLKKQNLLSLCYSDDLERAENFLMSRAIAEAQLLKEMRPYRFDLLVLAGFMRNLTPYFIDRVDLDSRVPTIMNIHPALLPAFPGTDGYGDTLAHGCKVGGCTVHFIDYGEDSGPIIGQRPYLIYPSDTLEDIKKRGLVEEWKLYPECIQLFAEGRLFVETNESGRKVVQITETHNHPGAFKSGERR